MNIQNVTFVIQVVEWQDKPSLTAWTPSLQPSLWNHAEKKTAQFELNYYYIITVDTTSDSGSLK